jgi:serine phosphatase RsbU (regulator of sigma subunit)/anti-sigma regulatory factor (Ser/Thr protein kinase)
MTPLLERLKRLLGGSAQPASILSARPAAEEPATPTYDVDIPLDDPLISFFERAPDPIQVDKLPIDTPGVRALRRAGVSLVVPLVSQGELVGILNLGPRLGEQQYSTDDRVLLNNLATQAAPAVRVAQLARRQQLEAQARERIEQELRVARLIQETLLPKEVPILPGWNIAALWRPAREVGGDFYDFMRLSDGRVVIVIGDVTDKGVPAAMVMATTRTMLRSAAMDTDSPGYVLQIVNDRLCREIPPKMFVTCLYSILDPETGRLSYANAGHDLPFRGANGRVGELRATGMPLGLLPGMRYEENETVIEQGEGVLLYSDGLVEAHNPAREMFGFPRLAAAIARRPAGHGMIDYLMNELARFTGIGWEQEDDVTLVTLDRSPAPSPPPPLPIASHMPEAVRQADEWRRLDRFELPSAPGNEREASRRVALAVEPLGLPLPRVERLKTAVAESVMNAIEHGNMNQAELLVEVEVYVSHAKLLVRIADQGLTKVIPPPQVPDLDAKLAGLQSPRGWGMFLIEKMVDSMRAYSDESHHTVELELNLE